MRGRIPNSRDAHFSEKNEGNAQGIRRVLDLHKSSENELEERPKEDSEEEPENPEEHCDESAYEEKVQRPRRVRRLPDRHGEWVTVAAD